MAEKNIPAGVSKRQAKEKEALITQLEKTPIVSVACEKTGVGRSTYYRWLEEDPEFEKRSSEALGKGVSLMSDMAESQLLRKVNEGNMTAVIFWLKSRNKHYRPNPFPEPKAEKKADSLSDEDRALINSLIEANFDDDEDECPECGNSGR